MDTKNTIVAVVGARIRVAKGTIPKRLLDALVKAYTHPNPDYAKKLRMGFSMFGIPKTIPTWHETETHVEFPRGAATTMRRLAADYGYSFSFLDRRVVRPAVKWPAVPAGVVGRPYQLEAVEAALQKQQGIIRKPTGCLAGDAVIGVSRGGKSFDLPIADLVHRFNGGEVRRGRGGGQRVTWDSEIPTFVRGRAVDGTIRLHALRNAYASGAKMTLIVSMSNGSSIRATADHRFLTGDGWKRLHDLRVGDLVYCESAHSPLKVRHGKATSRTRKPTRSSYAMCNLLRHHPYAGRRGVNPKKGGWSVPKHRLVAEAGLNGIDFDAFVERVRRGDTHGLKFLDPEVYAVHHRDRNRRNNAPENLEVLTHAEHRAEHLKDQAAFVMSRTELVAIESIEPGELEETYDLSIDAPHAFLANGIVVHNSGKTWSALEFLRRAEQPALVIMRDRNLLAQWKERAVTQLGLSKNEIGELRGGAKLRIGPRLTLALQQTLYSKSFPLETVAGEFGAVVVDEVHTVAAATFQRVIDVFPAKYRIGFSADECVARGTLITMGDGSLLPIEDVRAGDEVMTPLGPREVTAAMFKGIKATGLVEWAGGSVRCTENTWFAGPSGWQGQGEVSVVWSRDEQREDVQGVRAADEEALRGRVPHEVRAIGVRLDGGLLDVWSDGLASCACGSHGDAPRNAEGNTEERVDARGSLEGAEGEAETVRAEARGGVHAGATSTIEGDSARDVRSEPGDDLRRASVGEREATATERARGVRSDSGSRVLDGARGTDEGSAEAAVVHAGSREHGDDDQRRDRRVESQPTGAEGVGSTTGRAAGRLGVAGSSVLVDYRSLEAAQRGHRSDAATSTFDGLSVPVFDLEVDGAACYYANGALVHNTRKDRREFLVYDQFGDVIYEVERDVLESDGVIHNVVVRLVPTDFRADWYRDTESGARDFNRLLEEMTTDEARNDLILDLIAKIVRRDEKPVFVFTHRVEHARWLSNVGVFSRGITCGLMLGGAENAVRFNEDKARLAAGTLDVAAGTFQAIGQGIDVPHVEAGILATPIGNNRQFFNQVRGRVCRTAPGKRAATLYLIWDREVFPDAPRIYSSWNGGNVEVWDAAEEVWRPAKRR